MSRLIRLLVPAFVLGLLAGCAGGPPRNTNAGGQQSITESSGGDGSYRIPKQIRYSFTITNTTGKSLEKANFWTYLPVPKTSHQKVKKIAANHPYQEKRDELGNDSIHFELKNIPPYGTEIVSITVDLLMSDRAVDMAVGDQARFLSRESHIETDNDRIVVLASQLYGEPFLGMVREDYEWVAHNINYEGYVAEDRGAAYAMENRKGDCTEFSYLLTALYRAQKIPARPIGGYVFSGNGVVKAVDYHNWTEFYLDGAWQIADAQKGAFEDKQTDYVAMRVIASGGVAAVASQRFSYAGEGLKVEMN
jgi:transglutaminase-like putative cysteine protease